LIIRGRIAGAEEEIRTVYKRDKNLMNLVVKGIGPKIKKDLEPILEKGVDKVLGDMKMRTREIKRIERKDYLPTHSKIDRLDLTRRT